MKTSAIIVLSFFAATAACAQPQIAVGPNAQVSKANGGQEHAEVIAAADPNDAGHLLAGSMVLNRKTGGYDVTTYVSFDGGKQWRPTLDVATKFGYGGDPSVGFGCDGAAYSLNMTITGAGLDQRNLWVHRSTDGGKTWLPPVGLRWSDREYIVTDCTGSKYNGRTYILANGDMQTADGRFVSGVRIFVSKDGGKTFRVWSFPPASERGGALQGIPVVLSDGTFIGPFKDNSTDRSKTGDIIRVWRTEDGGETFSGAYTVAKLNGPSEGFPNLAADPGSGPFRDRVYAVWVGPRNDHGGTIYLAHSSDKGKTWSSPIAVNHSDTFPGKRRVPNRFMAEVAVNRDGVVGVAWYDGRGSTNGMDFTERFAASFDGGDTFTPSVIVSESPFLHDSSKSLPIVVPVFGGGNFLRTGHGGALHLVPGLNRMFYTAGTPPVWWPMRTASSMRFGSTIALELHKHGLPPSQ